MNGCRWHLNCSGRIDIEIATSLDINSDVVDNTPRCDRTLNTGIPSDLSTGETDLVSDPAAAPAASPSPNASNNIATSNGRNSVESPAQCSTGPTTYHPDGSLRDQPSKPGAFRARVLKGSTITVIGFGIGQALRFASSLVLTRLLVPEAFGFMSLSYALLEGLAMFSAMGEGPAVLRDKRGDDPDFVNTAWTVQVLRGNYLFLAACLLAWPMSRLYGEPLLTSLIPVIAITCLLEGFYSSAILTARRHLSLGRLTLMMLIAQVVGIATTIVLAYVYRTVWALVAGQLVEFSMRLVLSHTFLSGIPPRFRWEQNALRTLRELGKWIFLSSILEFIARQTDRLLLAYYVELVTLGIYAMAMNLCEPFAQLNMQMARNVFMPMLSRTHRDAPARLSEVFYKARLGVDAMLLPALGFIGACGPQIVDILYDDRYLAAGWMLQILCLRTAVRCLFEPSSAVCVAFGKPKYVTASRFVRAIMIVTAIPAGWFFGGLEGLVWCTVFAELAVVFVLWYGQWKLGVFHPFRESLAFLMTAAGWSAGVAALHFGLFDGIYTLLHLPWR